MMAWQKQIFPVKPSAFDHMRPVIFSSVALVYRVWLDLRKTGDDE